MDPNEFTQGLTRETTIRRDADGRWFQDDILLQHPKLTRAFDTWLAVADDGRYCLKNDVNWAYVTIEGAPLFVRSVRIEKDAVWIHLSDDRDEELAPASLRLGPDGALYCTSSKQGMAARFERNPMLQLEPIIGEDEQGVFICVEGKRWRPPMVQDGCSPIKRSG